MDATLQQAAEVILALRAFESRLKEIMDAIANKKTIPCAEKERLQDLIKPLKQDIKDAAKRGTVADRRAPPTEFERAYFAPALRSASANFTVTTNSHPLTSNWFSCLYDVRIDIGHPLFHLEKRYPGI